MFHPEDTVVDVAGVKIGGQEKIVVIGGPCSVESREQICEIAKEVKAAGADMLRGGAYSTWEDQQTDLIKERTFQYNRRVDHVSRIYYGRRK